MLNSILLRKAVRTVLSRAMCSFKASQCDQDNPIVVTKHGPVMTIGINRPEKCNALNYDTACRLSDALTQFEEDKCAHVGVLYGVGGNFSSGYDLKEMADSSEKAKKLTNLRLTDRYVLKPVIAAVSGYAVGLGFSLAMWCDMRVVEDTAVMGCLQRRFGIIQSEGNLERLVHSVGLSKTLDWVITGRMVKAKEAYECGIAARLVACGTSLGQAISLAQSVAKFPQSSLTADRAGIYLKCLNDENLQTGLASTHRAHYMKLSGQEAEEGAKKFVSGVGRKGKSTNISRKA